MRVCGGGGVGFHTMFLLALVSVFLYLAALCMFVYLCLVRPFGALPRILNILARHTIVFPCGAWGLWGNNGDIWLWFVFVRMLYGVPVGSSFFFACGVVPLAASFTTYLVSSPTHF